MGLKYHAIINYYRELLNLSPGLKFGFASLQIGYFCSEFKPRAYIWQFLPILSPVGLNSDGLKFSSSRYDEIYAQWDTAHIIFKQYGLFVYFLDLF